MVLDGQ
jgi:hypothetical protein